MSEVLKWFEDNIYYSVNSGNATFSIQNEDLWEFEELLKKQDRELQQKESIIKEAINYIKEESWFCYKDNEEVIDRTPVNKLLEILGGNINERI